MTTIDLSDSDPPRRRWWQAVLAWTAAAAVYALVLSSQVHLPLLAAANSSAVYVFSLAILVLPAQAFARRALEARRASASVIGGHVVFGLVTVAAWFGVNVLVDRLAVGPDFWTVIYANNWQFQLLSSMTAYGTVIGLTIATAGWRRERERERREAALVLQARDAELNAIRTQLQPHFVLNALNSVLALIDARPAEARTMVVRLADVMKEVFDRRNQPTVTLERELKLVQAYLDVEQIRFGSRLGVTIDVDPSAAGVMVPAFLLQPLVENAIKHGIAPHAGPGEVIVRARRDGGNLLIDVLDSGRGPAHDSSGGGQGLSLTQRRLETMYGSRASLDLSHAAGSGTTVRVVLPIESTHGG